MTPDLNTLRLRLADGRNAAATHMRGDHDLNPEFSPAGRQLVEAAVLVLLVAGPDGWSVVLTQRTAHLQAHAGQVSFPGGRMEPGDSTPEACALREAEEEIGLDGAVVELIGRLDTYVTRTGFRVTPVIGWCRGPMTYEKDPFEVAEVFEVPLSFFLDPGNVRRDTHVLLGKQRIFYAFPYGDHYIWGATAGMLMNLREALSDAC